MKRFFEFLFEPVQGHKVLCCERKPSATRKDPNVNGTRVDPLVEREYKQVVARANARQHNLFFHCGVDLGEESQNRKVRLKNVDVTGVAFLWADIDDGNFGQEQLDQILADEFAPSIVVFSGSQGYHLYWPLEAYETDVEAASAKIRWLAQRFGGDGVADMARILRVPSSYNHKVSPAAQVTIVHFEEKRFPFASFGEVRVSKAKVDLGIDILPLSDEFLADSRMTDWMRTEISTEAEEGERSSKCWRVADKMAASGFTEQEIMSVLMHPEWPIGEKGNENPASARNTAAKACTNKSNLGNFVAMMEKAFEKKPEAPTEVPITLDWTRQDKLRRRILELHHQVLEEDGEMRAGNKHAPKLGGVFGEMVAQATADEGYRYFYDEEYQQGFIADRKGGVWMVSKKEEVFQQFITAISGFSKGQQEFGFIAGGIESFVKTHGEKVGVGRWVHFDKDRLVYYVLADHRTGLIYCINENGEVAEEFNGVNDVFLRPRLQATAPLALVPGLPPRKGIEVLERLFHDNIAGPNEVKRFLMAYLVGLTLAYGSPISTLPMIHLTGESGGGKSATLEWMTSFLFGYVQLMGYTTASAYRVAANETFIAHDDQEKVADDLEHFLLVCATGSNRNKSDMNSASAIVIQKAHVVNGITAINQLDTVALRRRTFVLEIDRVKYPSKEKLSKYVSSDIIDNRDVMWSGLLPIFAAAIKAFKSGEFRDLSNRVYDSISVRQFQGLAEYLALMVLIDRVISEILGRPFDEKQTIADFTAVTGLQDQEEMLGRDPLVLCLQSYFEKLLAPRAREMYDVADITSAEENGSHIHTLAINRGMRNFQWDLTTEKENEEVAEKLGCKVRGIKASAAGWVSIFAADTREFSRTINCPASLGRQYTRVENKADYPFYITSYRTRLDGKIWNVFQKIDSR